MANKKIAVIAHVHNSKSNLSSLISLAMNNQNDHSAIGLAMAIEPPKRKPDFFGVDLAKDEDCHVEVEGYIKDDKLTVTDFKTIERQPDVRSSSDES